MRRSALSATVVLVLGVFAMAPVAADDLVPPPVGVTVDADVECAGPAVAGPWRPVHHADLDPLDAAPDALRESRVVRGVAVDDDERFAQRSQAVQHGPLLPVARVPDLVHVREPVGDEVQQASDPVPSLRVADDSETGH